MTARRVVTLTCDKDGCREHYVGGAGQTAQQVRSEARKVAGWGADLLDDTAARPGDLVLIDLCRWHS